MITIIYLLRDALWLWYLRGADQLSATVAYYALFAIVPIIFYSVYFVGSLYGEDIVINALLTWGSGMGAGVIHLLEEAVRNFADSAPGTVTIVLWVVLFVTTIIAFFNALIEGFHRLFGVPHQGVSGIYQKIIRSFFCFFTLQVFIVVIIALEFFFATFGRYVLFSPYLLSLCYIGGLTILLTIWYRFLTLKAVPALPSRFYGAFIASICFVVSRAFVTLHIALAPVPDFFGAAGLLIILLLWVYVSVTFVYFGAAFAQVHHLRYHQK